MITAHGTLTGLHLHREPLKHLLHNDDLVNVHPLALEVDHNKLSSVALWVLPRTLLQHGLAHVVHGHLVVGDGQECLGVHDGWGGGLNDFTICIGETEFQNSN